MAEEFTVNWWEHLYNNTADKIDTKKAHNKIDSEPVNDTAEVKEKAEKYNTIMNRKGYFYSRFQKVK